MLGKQSGQIDIFNEMIFQRLIPKEHLLVKIDSIVDFSFVYDICKDLYSEVGRESTDPVVLVKMNLLEYLYTLSDREVETRTQTDIAFRWFLRLSLDDKVPDYTTISYFRAQRLGSKPFEKFFNAIVQQCIDNDLIGKKRYIVDSTDVAANTNYPKEKRLVCDAYRRLIEKLGYINPPFAEAKLNDFESDIQKECDMQNEKDPSKKVSIKTYCSIAKKHAEEIYVKSYDDLKNNAKCYEVFSTLWLIIEQYGENKTKQDRIISFIDPDARVGNKTKGNLKRGYKDHIIIDEESEIILASEQTPFNEGDEIHLVDLVEKVQENFDMKPEEVSADTVYGTTGNRAYLKDNNIISNIRFRDLSKQEHKVFDIKMFDVAEDLKSVTCPNGCITTNVRKRESKKGIEKIIFKFSEHQCEHCILRDRCIDPKSKVRTLLLSTRYDAVTKDIHRNKTIEFEKASGKRYIVERRFSTLVVNNGLRRCRFLKIDGAKIHITLANTACNIVRMVNLLWTGSQSNFVIAKS
ncbi:MAG: IS1182 family transposase [Bacillota bacterium]|nr:IS1182 family transposase [Bacillota bacterium]